MNKKSRLLIPVAVFAVAAVTAVLPTVTSADNSSVAVSIHDGGAIDNWGYGPSTTTISVGQSVTFANSGASPHDATAADGSWKTPLLTSGATASITFSAPGSFDYMCALHPWMKGTIVVTPAVTEAAPAPAAAPVDVTPPTTPAVTAPQPAAPVVDLAPAAPSDETAPQAGNPAVTDGSGADDN